VEAGDYLFDRVITVHESHPEVKGLLGTKVLMFRSQSSVQKVYVYPGPLNMVPLQDAIVVSASDFLELCAGLARGASTLEVKSVMFQWGAQRLFGEAIPMVYRHLFDGPLEDLAEPTGQWRREQEQRQRDALAREEARRRAEAQLREASMLAQAEQMRREAQAQAEQQAAQARQRAASQSRPAASQSRVVHRSLPGSSTRRNDDDSLADFMFMSMFPDVAPLYRPNSFMAWYLWSQEQGKDVTQPFTGAGGQFDGGGASGDWQPAVPGFPDAVSQRVTTHGDSQRVELLDASGRSVGSFVVTENNGQTQFAVPGGHVFTVADQGKPTIEYASDSGQRFSWDGESEPVVESVQDNSPAVSTYSSSTYSPSTFEPSNSFFDSGSSPSTTSDNSGYSNTPSESQSMDSTTSY